ncbi:MAG: fibronectin type III domain-containing protein [Bacteroidota bacterium]
MKRFIFVLVALLPIAFAFTPPTDVCVTCPTPTNVKKTAETATTISFSWDAVDAADEYIVRYVRQSDGLTSGNVTVSSNSHTFSSMQAGTYDFYFSAKCGGITSSSFIVIDDVNGF